MNYIECKNALKELYKTHGKPAKNDGRYTTTETEGFSLVDDDYPNDDDKTIDECDEHDQAIINVAAMADIRYVGSGIWYTSVYHTDEYQAYQDAAREIIQQFVDGE